MQFTCQTERRLVASPVNIRLCTATHRNKGLSISSFDIPRPPCKNDWWDSLHDEQLLRSTSRNPPAQAGSPRGGGYIMKRCSPFAFASPYCRAPFHWRLSPLALPRAYDTPSAALLGRSFPAGASSCPKGHSTLPVVALLGWRSAWRGHPWLRQMGGQAATR